MHPQQPTCLNTMLPFRQALAPGVVHLPLLVLNTTLPFPQPLPIHDVPTIATQPLGITQALDLKPQAVTAWWQPGHPGWAIHPADSERFAATGELHVERFEDGDDTPRLGARLRARASLHAGSGGTAARSYTTGSPGTSIVQDSSAQENASVAAGPPGSVVSGSPRAVPYVLAPAAAANLQQAVLSVFGGRDVVRVASSPAVAASVGSPTMHSAHATTGVYGLDEYAPAALPAALPAATRAPRTGGVQYVSPQDMLGMPAPAEWAQDPPHTTPPSASARVVWTAQSMGPMSPVTPGAMASAGPLQLLRLPLPAATPVTSPIPLAHPDDDDDNMPTLPSFGSDYLGTLRSGPPGSFTMPGAADMGMPGLFRHTSANTDMLLQALDDPDEACTSRALPSDPFVTREMEQPPSSKAERDSKRPRRH